MARRGRALERRSVERRRGPLGERVAEVVERRLAQAVARRVGGGSSDRRPGRLEQRLVGALERRLSGRSRKPADTPAWARVGRTLARRRPPGTAATRPQQTLRALVVGILARTAVKALLRLVRILSRGLISRPVRRLAALLARRAIRADPTNQLGILAFLIAAILLAYRALIRRLARLPDAQQTAIKLGARGTRGLLGLLLRLVVRVLRVASARLRREVRRGAERYARR